MEKLMLNKIISKGSLIKTSHSNSPWITNVVLNVYDNTIQIELKEGHIESLIFVGDKIKGKFSVNNLEYLFEGIVQSIDMSNLCVFEILIEKINAFENTRGSDRYDTHIISKMNVSKNAPIYAIVTSISPSGISLLSKCDFPLDGESYIEVFINRGCILSFDGKVMRKTPSCHGFEYGIKITNIDEENNSILSDLLNHLKMQDRLVLDRYLSSL